MTRFRALLTYHIFIVCFRVVAAASAAHAVTFVLAASAAAAALMMLSLLGSNACAMYVQLTRIGVVAPASEGVPEDDEEYDEDEEDEEVGWARQGQGCLGRET